MTVETKAPATKVNAKTQASTIVLAVLTAVTAVAKVGPALKDRLQ